MYYGSGWKKNRASARQINRGKELPFRRFQRSTAQIQLARTGEVVNGRVFLHDLSDQGISIFLTTQLPRDAEVFVVLEAPRHLFVRGRVAWSTLYRLNTRVISAENYQYRARIQFEFESPGDRELVRRYVDELGLEPFTK